MNHVTLSGRLAMPPLLRETAGGNRVCKILLAFSQRSKDPQHAVGFAYVKVWDGLADVAASLRKGDAVIVTGSLRHSVFDSNGVALERLEINDATLKKIAVDDVDRRLSDAAKDIKARGEKGGHESKSR